MAYFGDEASTSLQGVPASPSEPGTSSVGIFLEEIAYFLDDMERDLWWLLQAAHQPGGHPDPVRGDEELEPVSAEVRYCIQTLRERADLHSEAHEKQVRAKIVIIPSVTPEERAVLQAVRNLRFHCKGRVEVFQCMKEANNSRIWAAYFKYVGDLEPQWMVKTDGPGQKILFAQCIVVVPVYVDRSQQIKLFNVWCPEKKKRHWAFPGGDILRGVDGNLYDTARRTFEDQVGIFFERKWNDCFRVQLPSDGRELEEPAAFMFAQLEKDGHRYPTRPHFFVQVTEDFYKRTSALSDAGGIIKIPQPKSDFVRWGDSDPDNSKAARRVHTEGVCYWEYDEAQWVSLEFATGKVLTDDGRPMRKENADLFKSQPEKVWHMLGTLAGLDPVQRTSLLPSDFPLDGPFAVQMHSIDKTATDNDIREFFEEAAIKVKRIEQFENPRHTARIDFEDVAALEGALQLSGRNLLRRKIKITLWNDNGEGGCSAPVLTNQLKPYNGPLPDDPPFKVSIRGLDKTVTRDDIGYFFWDRECQVKDVEYPVRNERHCADVEFPDQDSMRNALGLNQAIFKGREVSIEIAGKEDRPLGGGGGGGRSKGGKGKGYGGGDRERDRDGFGGGGMRDRDRAGGREREPPSRAEFGSERPRLQIAPRTKPLPGEPGYREPETFGGSKGGSDPFGGARAREERFKPTRADGDGNWRR